MKIRPLTSLILLTLLLALIAGASTSTALEIAQVNRIELAENQYAAPTETGWYVHDRKDITVYSVDLTPEVGKSIKGNERIVISDKGSYFALLRYNDKSPTDIALLNVDVFDRAGNRLWSVANPRAVTVELNDLNGSAIGIAGAEGLAKSVIDFYSSSGRYTGSATATYLSGRKWHSKDDVALINSADSGLRAYDTTGSMVADYGPAKRFALSEDGSLLAATSPGEVRYYRNGFKVGAAKIGNDNGNTAAVAISNSASLVVVMRRDRFSAFRLPALDSMWQVPSSSAGGSLSSLAISPKGLIAIGFDTPQKESGNTYHTEGGVRLYDTGGLLLWSLDLTYTDWSREYPIARFSSDGQYLLVATKDEALSFRIGDSAAQQ